MPGTLSALEGVPGFWTQIHALERRIAGLEAALRQASAITGAGAITGWPGATAPPGALACDGSTFDPVTFPQLAAVLGGSTLPNLAGPPLQVIWTGPPSSI